MTTQEFAEKFYKELKKDHWGAIDPFLFACVADETEKEDVDEETWEEVIALEKALLNVLGG